MTDLFYRHIMGWAFTVSLLTSMPQGGELAQLSFSLFSFSFTQLCDSLKINHWKQCRLLLKTTSLMSPPDKVVTEGHPVLGATRVRLGYLKRSNSYKNKNSHYLLMSFKHFCYFFSIRDRRGHFEESYWSRFPFSVKSNYKIDNKNYNSFEHV